MALLVLLVLPSAQIKLGASRLNGLIGSYTGGGTPPHYDVSYSGGTIVSDSPASFAPGDAQNYYGTGSASSFGVYKTCTGSAKGPLTAHFNWNNGGDPTALPPTAALVSQNCSASWSSTLNAGATITGSAYNGLDGTPAVTGTGSGSSSGVAYTVKDDPGQSFDVNTCSPTVSFNTDDGYFYDASATGTVTVLYAAAAQPTGTITLPGASTDVDGSKKALTGQGVTAQFGGLPAGYKITGYTWSFDGGTPIKNWDPGAMSNDKTVALTPGSLSATDTTGDGIAVADLSFYDSKADTLTVTCAVNFTGPDGKAGKVSVKAHPINYLKPTVDWKLNNFNPAFKHPKGFFSDPPSRQYGAEEPWGPITITVPDPFAGGNGSIAQIATLSRSYTRHSPQAGTPDTSYKKVSVLNLDGTAGNIDSPTGLDISYPYPYGYNKNADGSFTLVKKNYAWQAGGMGYSDDQPFASYTTTDVDGGGNNWWSSGASDSFDTWVMYIPPPSGGQGTIYVPLMKLTWKWGGYASLSNGNWTSGEGTPFTPGAPSVTDTYPSWLLSIPSGFSVGP